MRNIKVLVYGVAYIRDSMVCICILYHFSALKCHWLLSFTLKKDENNHHFNGLVQDYSISSALAMEILQSCTKLSIGCCQYHRCWWTGDARRQWHQQLWNYLLNRSTNIVLRKFSLSHYNLLTPYGYIDLNQHLLRWLVIAWLHKAISWTDVDFSSVKVPEILLRAIPGEILKISMKCVLKLCFWNSSLISEGPMS